MANPNPSPFTSENRHTGGKPGARKPTGLYKVMKDIFDNKTLKPDKDATDGVKALRKMLKEKPGDFIMKMGQLEQAFFGKPRAKEPAENETGPGKEAQVPEKETDEGEAKAIELVTRLLREKPWEKS